MNELIVIESKPNINNLDVRECCCEREHELKRIKEMKDRQLAEAIYRKLI